MRKRQFKKQQKKLLLGHGRSYKLGRSAAKAQNNKRQESNDISLQAFRAAAEAFQKNIPEYVRNKGAAYVSEYLEYKKLARKADRRLRALEAYAQEKYYKGIERYAYARAMHDIEMWSGPGSKRFDTKPPEDLKGLRAKMNDIKLFLESPTSTKRGVTEIYKKRADTINKEYGTNLTWQEIADYYTSEAHEKAAQLYGSKTELLAFASEIRKVDVDRIRGTLKQRYANVDYVRQSLKQKGWKVNTR